MMGVVLSVSQGIDVYKRDSEAFSNVSRTHEINESVVFRLAM